MLFAKRNQAYVDDEEQAKKITFERTIKWVNRLYPEENKEVKLTPVKISSQLQYGYDTLFESFKSSVEQVLSASYNDDKTTEKSFETTRKYNQLSSYLKNIMNMNQMTPNDEERIKKDFDGMKDKLIALKNLAVANGFGNVEAIVEMVDTINSTTPTPKSEYDKVKSTPTNMVTALESKTTLQSKLNYIKQNIGPLQTKLKNPSQEEINIVNINQELSDAVNTIINTKVLDYDVLLKNINKPDVQDTINDLFDEIKYIEDNLYSSVSQNKATTITQMINESTIYLAEIPPKITKIENNIADANNSLDAEVDPFIAQKQKEYEEDLNNDFTEADTRSQKADNVLQNLNPPVAPDKNTLVPMVEPIEPTKPPKFVKDNTQSNTVNIKEKQKHLTDKENYENDKLTYARDKRVYDTAMKDYNTELTKYNKNMSDYNRDETQYTKMYDEAEQLKEDITNYLGESKTFWNDASEKIKQNVLDNLKDINTKLNDIKTNFNVIQQNPPRDEDTIKTYYDELKDMDSDLVKMSKDSNNIFVTHMVSPTLPKIGVSKGPGVDFKQYFVDEYNKKFKDTKTKRDLQNKWNYYLTKNNPNPPNKASVDAYVLKVKKL